LASTYTAVPNHLLAEKLYIFKNLKLSRCRTLQKYYCFDNSLYRS